MKFDWRFFAAGLAMGGVVGLVWGLFNAPYSGQQTQQLIAEKIQESITEGQEAMAARRQELRASFEQARDRER
jgi:gas vesicle protein